MVAERVDEDIAAWQANWNVPYALLDEVVRQATGSGLVLDERILEGHSSEVHGVVTEEGQRIIVRVAWRSGPVFERERWPMEAARLAGLPVPEVILIEHTTLHGEGVSFNVQSRLSGSSIYRLVSTLTDVDLSRLTRQAGRLLAAVHSIETAGRGPINASGKVDASLATHPEDSTEGLAERTPYLVDHGVDRELAEQAARIVLGRRELLDQAPVCLVHGGWSLANLVCDGNSITGVVDWEGAGGGDPTLDLTQWDFWHDRGPTATESLMVGYREAGGSTDEDFESRRLVRRIANLHDAASHFIFTNRPDLVDRAIVDLRAVLGRAQGML